MIRLFLHETLPCLRESAQRWVAFHAPRWLVYWALIRAGSHGIEGDEMIVKVPFFRVLERWSHDN